MLVTACPAELVTMNATGQESRCRVLEPSALPGTNALLAGFEGGARGLRKVPWVVGAFGKRRTMTIYQPMKKYVNI